MRLEVAAIRGHGDGTLFERDKAKRKPGEKPTFVSAVTMRNGRRASRTTHSRDAAKAALAELLRLRDAGAPITGRIRLGDFLERWVSDVAVRVAPSTWRKHESIVRVHIAPVLGHIRLSELRPDDVEHLFRSRAGHDPQTVRHIRATLRRSLADAVREGLVARNAAALARPPGLPHRERTILDAAQARSLIESTRGTRYGPLWTILVTTGLRISEALGLAWSDVTFDASGGPVIREYGGFEAGDGNVSAASVKPRTRPTPLASLTVRHQLAREDGEWVRRQPKTAKGRRTIPLTPLGVDALRAQREQQREWLAGYYGSGDAGNRPRKGLAEAPQAPHLSERVPRAAVGSQESNRPLRASSRREGYPTPLDALVFTTERGRPIHGENLLPKLRADLAAAGLPRVTIHDLRHSCATVLFAAGVPLPVVSRILGHSTVRITMDTYVGRIPELNREAAEKMQEALSS